MTSWRRSPNLPILLGQMIATRRGWILITAATCSSCIWLLDLENPVADSEAVGTADFDDGVDDTTATSPTSMATSVATENMTPVDGTQETSDSDPDSTASSTGVDAVSSTTEVDASDASTGSDPVRVTFDIDETVCTAFEWFDGAENLLDCPSLDLSRGIVATVSEDQTIVLGDTEYTEGAFILRPGFDVEGPLVGRTTAPIQLGPTDVLRARVGCASGSQCLATFQVTVTELDSNDPAFAGTGTLLEAGDVVDVDVPLDQLPTRSVSIELRIDPIDITDDSTVIVWAEARIESGGPS